MEKQFDIPPVRVATHPNAHDRLALGFIDGSIGFYQFDVSKDKLKILRCKKLKTSVRQLGFSLSGEQLYSVCSSKALCVYDVETNKRVRCVLKCHDDKPNELRTLPSSSTKGQQLATADESGQIRTWDMRVSSPQITSFDDLEDIVNQLDVCGSKLLAACSDGTLGAYDLRNRKLIVRSEPMSSELLSITSTKKFTYVGNGDGYLEVFKRDEYGNILERIETPHSMGIDCVRSIRDDILLTSSNESPDIRLIHVDPNKTLGSLGTHEGGVQQLTLTNDHFWLISVGMMKSTVKFWNVPHLLDKIPIMRSNDLSKQKGKKLKVSNSFFDDLIGDEGEKDSDESNEDESESGNEDESVSDEEMYESEESANEGIAENSGLSNEEQQSSSDENSDVEVISENAAKVGKGSAVKSPTNESDEESENEQEGDDSTESESSDHEPLKHKGFKKRGSSETHAKNKKLLRKKSNMKKRSL